MLEALHKFFEVFGAATVVPAMIFIVSLFLKVNPRRAFFSALRAGLDSLALVGLYQLLLLW